MSQFICCGIGCPKVQLQECDSVIEKNQMKVEADEIRNWWVNQSHFVGIVILVGTSLWLWVLLLE